jgi:hypothetical protein
MESSGNRFIKKEDISALSQEEINAILRAADDITACGGRTLLTKILKGSKDKKLLQLNLDQNPSYGFFSSFKPEQIILKIDWMIYHDFLEIQYSGKLPMLVFTEKGWKLECDQYARELLHQWDEWLNQGITSVSMEYLKERNRELILLFLKKIQRTSNAQYIPFLKQWEQIEYRKVRQAICKVISYLERAEDKAAPTDTVFDERPEPFESNSLAEELLKCLECGKRFVWSVEEQKVFKLKGFVRPKRCPACREKRWLRNMGIDIDEA